MPTSYLNALCNKKPSYGLQSDLTASSPTIVPDTTKQAETGLSAKVEYVLINTGNGPFRYSDAFKQGLASLGYIGDLSGDRSSILVLVLFDKKGSEWSSGKDCSLKKVAVPVGFGKYITVIKDKNNKAGETVHLDFCRASIELSESLMNQPQSSMDDIRALNDKVETAKKVWKIFCIPLNNDSDKNADTSFESSDEVVNESGDEEDVSEKFDYIIINKRHRMFRYSDKFKQELKRRGLKGKLERQYPEFCCDRWNPLIVQLFAEKGSEWSSGGGARLKMVAVPAGYVEYADIHEYDERQTLRGIDFDRAFAEGVEKIMTKDYSSDSDTVSAEVLTLQAEIDAAKEVWEECQRINDER